MRQSSFESLFKEAKSKTEQRRTETWGAQSWPLRRHPQNPALMAELAPKKTA